MPVVLFATLLAPALVPAPKVKLALLVTPALAAAVPTPLSSLAAPRGVVSLAPLAAELARLLRLVLTVGVACGMRTW